MLHLDPSQNYSGTQFVLTSDANSGSDVTLSVGVFVSSGHPLIVTSGQTSDGVTVLSSGTMSVQSGGIADRTVISAGGTVNDYGLTTGTTVDGGLEFLHWRNRERAPWSAMAARNTSRPAPRP